MKSKDAQKQEEYFKSNISNIVNVAQYRYYAKFTDFLDEYQQALAQQHLNRLAFFNYFFFGGTNNSTRKMLGVFPLEEECLIEAFPITALQIDFSNQITLTHRDFLGSLMGLQISRACVGDILIDKGKAIIFVSNEVANFVLLNLTKIGRANVKVEICSELSIEHEQKFKEIEGTISSMRLDCIVAFLLNKSRTLAVQVIQSRRVKINHFDVDSVSYLIKPNDIITIQGKGKFIVDDTIKPTKKNRLHIKIKQYI